jgi:hypothetical protein
MALTIGFTFGKEFIGGSNPLSFLEALISKDITQILVRIQIYETQ